MKNATQYTQKLKQLLTRLKKNPVPEPAIEGELRPMEVLVLAIMRRNASASQAVEALERIRAEFVDFNEMRVAPPRDLVEVFGRKMPDVRLKGEQLPAMLNHVFDQGHDMELQYLQPMAKRERRTHLRDALGLDDFGAAFIELYLFDEPTVPVDERMLARLQADGCAPADASAEEVRALLDKAVPAKEARACFELLSAHADQQAPVPDELPEPEDDEQPATKTARRAPAKKAKAAKAAKGAPKKSK